MSLHLYKNFIYLLLHHIAFAHILIDHVLQSTKFLGKCDKHSCTCTRQRNPRTAQHPCSTCQSSSVEPATMLTQPRQGWDFPEADKQCWALKRLNSPKQDTGSHCPHLTLSEHLPQLSHSIHELHLWKFTLCCSPEFPRDDEYSDAGWVES